MNWNSVLLQANTGELYTGNDNIASFDLHFVTSSNIEMIGISQALKQMLIIFKNGGKYLYKDVTPEVMNSIINQESIGSYMTHHVKGFFRYEQVYWIIEKASITDVVKHFRNMQYTLTVNIGCMVTDAINKVNNLPGGEKVVDDNFWKMEFTEQPDNAQRIR